MFLRIAQYACRPSKSVLFRYFRYTISLYLYRSVATSPLPPQKQRWECKIVSNSRPNDAVIVNTSKLLAVIGSILCIRSAKEPGKYKAN